MNSQRSDMNIETFRGQGRALRTDVQHQFSVLTVINDQAVVTDHIPRQLDIRRPRRRMSRCLAK